MSPQKVVIAGGTGFVGTYLTKQFASSGYQVLLVARQKNCIQWQDTNGIITALNGAAMLINLVGKSVDCRYNEKNKNEILHSRADTTILLRKAILQCEHPPELWINSSTATIYRHAEDRPMTESDGEIGTGFSVSVATQWEQAFFEIPLPQTRQIALRMAIVLGQNGGMMTPMMRLVRFGLGGKQGNGKQMFSWIHIEDLFSIIRFLLADKELSGVFNCSSPFPVSNKLLMQALRRAMNVKFGIPSPKFLLEIGALLIRTETELILKSRWVIPEKLIKCGFKFKYPEINQALVQLIQTKEL